MDIRIDFSRFTGSAEKGEVTRQQNLQIHLQGQAEIERNPTYFQRQQESEGRSEWSGGTWAGRSR
jgi:hypothetical protein